MAEAYQADFIAKVIEVLKAQTIPGIDPGDIRYEELQGIKQPSYGICVSSMQETEGRGTNGQDDIRYGVQVTRLMSKLNARDGLQNKSLFRDLILDLFHRKRIGVDPDKELITTVRHSTWVAPRQWRKNMDSTSMNIYCLIRRTRT